MLRNAITDQYSDSVTFNDSVSIIILSLRSDNVTILY